MKRNTSRTKLERFNRRQMLEAVSSAVAVPIHLEVDSAGIYILVEQGREVARWREADHPGLAAWISTRMHERYAALVLAREAAKTSADRSGAGDITAERNSMQDRHPKLSRAIRRALERGEDPREYRDTWPGEYRVSRTTFYALIKALEETASK